MDANGDSLVFLQWQDADMGDKTLRRDVRYPRKWRLDLQSAEEHKAAELYAKGRCAIIIRPSSLYLGDDTFVSKRNLTY